MNALSGLKVLDFSRYIAGPYCCQLLGDMGADVIKIETPKGDVVREFSPGVDGTSYYFMALNRNKKSITVNTRTEAGKELLSKLIREADVLVQNFKPGTMEAMGFTWEALQELNPRLIYVAVSGYGLTGPMAGSPAFDRVIQAMGGLMHLTGDPEGSPYAAGVFVVDFLTAAHAAFAILGAVIAREKTGKGQMIDASLMKSAATLLLDSIPAALLIDENRMRVGNGDVNAAPVGCYLTKDGGYAIIIGGINEHWQKLVKVIGREDMLSDPRFATLKDRCMHSKELDEILIPWALQHDRDEIVEALTAAELPTAPVLSIKEFLRLPQVAYVNMLIELTLGNGMKIPVQGPAYTFSDDPFNVRFGPPELGQHTDEILSSLGYSAKQIEELHKSKSV